MQSKALRFVRVVVAAVVALAVLAAVFATFVTVSHSDAWWIRELDYPRWENVAILLVLGALVMVLFRPRRWPSRVLTSLVVCALAYQATILWPFTSVARAAAVDVPRCADERELDVLSLNVRQRNDRIDAVRSLIEEQDPEIVLLMETNEQWREGLAPLFDRYPDKVLDALSDTYGMLLLSKRPLEGTKVRYPTKGIPQITTRVTLGSGEAVRLYALHPRPPREGQGSSARDAYLMRAALDMHDDPLPVVAIGDFNSVPWERVVRRLERVGGLMDPRVGRAYLPTWSAEIPLLSVPLDQVLFRPRFALVELRRLEDVGSDHFPLRAKVCYAPDAAEAQSPSALRPDDLAIAKERASADIEQMPKGEIED